VASSITRILAARLVASIARAKHSSWRCPLLRFLPPSSILASSPPSYVHIRHAKGKHEKMGAHEFGGGGPHRGVFRFF
jgi:hypothetical protein